MDKLPTWLVFLIVVRAGVVEELAIAVMPSNGCALWACRAVWRPRCRF
jgi:hypothetical protein